MNKTVKLAVQWVLAVLFFLLAFAWMPSLMGLIYLVAIVIILPIKPLENFCEKHNIKFGMRIVAIVICFVIGFILFMNGRGESDPYSGGNGNKVTNETLQPSDTSDVNIAGTWVYVEETAVDMDYKFNSDGSWKFSSEGGANNEGTYEIADGVIKAHGMYSDEPLEFKIISNKQIEDSAGRRLKKK